jgi:hypothetical protein
LVEYLKPSAGRLTATTLQTCQMAKARNSAGTEIHRLSLATASPSRSQKDLSSGVQMVSVRPAARLIGLRVHEGFSFGEGAQRAKVRA